MSCSALLPEAAGLPARLRCCQPAAAAAGLLSLRQGMRQSQAINYFMQCPFSQQRKLSFVLYRISACECCEEYRPLMHLHEKAQFSMKSAAIM